MIILCNLNGNYNNVPNVYDILCCAWSFSNHNSRLRIVFTIPCCISATLCISRVIIWTFVVQVKKNSACIEFMVCVFFSFTGFGLGNTSSEHPIHVT